MSLSTNTMSDNNPLLDWWLERNRLEERLMEIFWDGIDGLTK